MLSEAKTRSIIIQGVLVTAVIAFAALLVYTTFANLRARGIPIGFDFLTMPSRIIISEAILTYKSRDPYYWAIVVGLANTVFVSALVIFFSSLLGLVVGITRLSSNPLAAGTCRVWVEIARNSPPIVLLIFLYSLWWKVLPPVGEALNPLPGVYASMRGFVVPAISIDLGMTGALIILFALTLAALSYGLARSGRLPPLVVPAILAAGVVLADMRFAVDFPVFTGSNFRGGSELTPELSTILVGLTIYTTGFVAEIVRGGVLSVGRGQWDAGHSLGLSRGKILRLVVIPQMLRVIVPPLNSQYINVVKNSTLAIAVGYPDFLAVMNTIISKSSHSIEGVFIILGAYLALNLTLSSAANWYNRRIAIVER
ncbi:MAG: ABC transporter permease subunit [Mesorhizobium sp.]|uniref:amino acid ABC transporter permease n=1 Tax=Mesorhizobium sp. TaxID=1871066 RepID=UPI000FE67A29|nr:ABC transporter permease subunit [Mesorhizobium sp.]RWH71738.1 MAG: ABC transporter permease subunit [Mesorhizobium sp.]RWH85604.1 MAG: ABC transporter permease subunit [Mesorhizobium sp.]RWH90860.1 MAG: ABC transporter permease subunit [Mesorhizobium sp.]RWH94664.1 MAG: ABC transporter permease subunit [Mesorhizobium sp.]RWH99542.1 MAG: ABC transporter permease subunit [Mesorhizobium sp.]